MKIINKIFGKILIPLAYYIRGDFRFMYYCMYKKNLKKTKKEIKEYQLQRLKKLVFHAYNTVPYYRELFDKNKIKPEDIRTLEDLNKIPPLTKKIINKNIEKLKSRKRYRLTECTSGGSTGYIVTVYKDKKYNEISKAVVIRDLFSAGVRPGDKVAWIWGSPFENLSLKKSFLHKLLWRINRRIVFNAECYTDFELNEWLTKDFRKFKPDYIYGYANLIYEIAKFAKKQKIALPKIKKIISTAETLRHRKFIEEVFKCPVIDQYGSREILEIGIEDDNYVMHSADDFVITEVTNDNKILLTPLESYGMPLLRYEIGDIGKPKKQKKHDMNAHPFNEFNITIGRTCELLLNKANERISFADFMEVLDEKLRVGEFQIVQKSLDYVELNVVRDENTKEKDVERLKEIIKSKLGCSDVKVKYFKTFPKAASGKKIEMICQINNLSHSIENIPCTISKISKPHYKRSINSRIFGYIIIPLAYYLRGDFRFWYYNKIRKSLKLTKQAVKNLQLYKLQKLLKHAYETVPYYKKLFDKNNINVEEINSVEDIKRIPLLDKKTIIKNIDLMKSNKKYFLRSEFSGGSTGNRVKVFKDKRFHEISRALILRDLYQLGILPGDKVAWFWSSPIENSQLQEKVMHRILWKINRRIIFNITNYSEKQAVDWLENKFNRFRPDFIYSYASSLYELAKIIDKHQIKIHRVKKAVATSEKLEHRNFIENVFGCPVYDEYGCREVCGISIEDENYIMHSNDDLNLVELGENNEVILTPLESYGMPLIRYKNGDIGYIQKKVGKTDNTLPFNHFNINVGRSCQVFRTMDNKRVDVSMVAHEAGEEELDIGEFQVIQKSLDLIEIKIVKDESTKQEHIERFKELLRKNLGSVKIDIMFVKKYPVEKSGKKISFKCLIQDKNSTGS